MDVKTIENGCPLCGSDVKGNDEVLFLCKRCQVLFKRKNLASHKNKDTLKPLTKIEPAIKKHVKEKQKRQDEERGIDSKFFASAKGKRYHAGNCPYIAFMNKENLVSYKKEMDAEKKGLSKCRCLRLKLR